MITNHGVTKIDSSGVVSSNGLVASNFKSQDEAIFVHLLWISEKIEAEILRYKYNLRLFDYYSGSATFDSAASHFKSTDVCPCGSRVE